MKCIGEDMSREILLEALFNHWRAQRHLRLANGLSSSEVLSFERRNNVSIPSDFSEYLKLTNGFSSPSELSHLNASDDEGFEFYPLLEKHLLSVRYLIFGGWPNGFLQYALCVESACDNGVVVQVIDENRGYLLAKTFSEFIALYLADSKFLYSAGTEVISLR